MNDEYPIIPDGELVKGGGYDTQQDFMEAYR